MTGVFERDAIEEITARADAEGVRIIDIKFATFCTMVYGVLPGDLPHAQLVHTRQAFFAGMVLYQGDVLQALESDDPEEDAKVETYVHRIAEELEDFAEGVLAQAMQTEGSA